MQDEPDSPFDPRGFSDSWWDFQRRKEAFEDHLLCYGAPGFDFTEIKTDSYDCSVELLGVRPEAYLNADQQKLIWDSGFSRCWLNHTDGWETYYSWDHKQPFSPLVGHRTDKLKGRRIDV